MAHPLPLRDRNVPIDFSRYFIPEQLTALFYTPSYAALSAAQKLRYNQLCYLYLSEHVVFFERTFDNYMRNVLSRHILSSDFVDKVTRWLAEEETHTRLFRELNKKIDPRYEQSSSLFVDTPHPIIHFILKSSFKRPELFPMYLLFMALQEERSMYYCSVYQAQRSTLDGQIADLQLLHNSDEIYHVTLNLELFQLLWERSSASVRYLNAALFSWMMGEYFIVPKRAGIKLLKTLCLDFTDLSSEMPKMNTELLALRDDQRFHEAQYSRSMVPLTFGVIDRLKEFSTLGKKLKSYSRTING